VPLPKNVPERELYIPPPPRSANAQAAPAAALRKADQHLPADAELAGGAAKAEPQERDKADAEKAVTTRPEQARIERRKAEQGAARTRDKVAAQKPKHRDAKSRNSDQDEEDNWLNDRRVFARERQGDDARERRGDEANVPEDWFAGRGDARRERSDERWDGRGEPSNERERFGGRRESHNRPPWRDYDSPARDVARGPLLIPRRMNPPPREVTEEPRAVGDFFGR
jgi:hypothetical protein